MGFWKRITNIVSARMEEMTSSMEDPALLLRQAIGEMEASIQKATHEISQVLAGEKKLGRNLAQHDAEIQKWQKRAEAAVQSNQDQHALVALKHSQEHQLLRKSLQDQLTQTSAASATLKHQLDSMRAKLTDAKQSLAMLNARQRSAEVRKKLFSEMQTISSVQFNESAFHKFERMREKVEQIEAEADALAELQGDLSLAKCSQSEWGETQEQGADLTAALQALKRKLGSGH